MKCNICEIEVIMPNENTNVIDSRNIAVKKDNQIICNACSESMMLFVETKTIKPKKVKQQPKVIAKSKPKFICHRCKSSYEGQMCKDCKTPNPLFSRKNLKKEKEIIIFIKCILF